MAMNKLLFVLWALWLVLLGAFALNQQQLLAKEKKPSQAIYVSEQLKCQYPTRPLVNGECDNSDPACPETIKEDGGDCLVKSDLLVTPDLSKKELTSERVGK